MPGSAFGPSGEGHVRATLATSYEQLEQALVRMKAFVDSLQLKALLGVAVSLFAVAIGLLARARRTVSGSAAQGR